MKIETFFRDKARGSDIRFSVKFRATAGETMADVRIAADLRFAGYKPAILTPDMPNVASFTIEDRSDNAGWFLTISDAATADLEDGYYVTDVRYTAGEITENGWPAAFKLYTPVTRGAA